MLGIKPAAAGSRSKYANHCAMLPLTRFFIWKESFFISEWSVFRVGLRISLISLPSMVCCDTFRESSDWNGVESESEFLNNFYSKYQVVLSWKAYHVSQLLVVALTAACSGLRNHKRDCQIYYFRIPFFQSQMVVLQLHTRATSKSLS